MHDDTQARPLTDLIPKGMTVAMVMTMVGRTHSSRPVTIADVRDGRLSFLVSRSSEWVTYIAAREAIVHVTIADDAHTCYVSLNGSAILTADPEEAQRLWSPAARAWFEGPEDPDLGVIHFDVSDGEYWDGPNGKISRAIALAKAALTGNDSPLGTQGPVSGSV